MLHITKQLESLDGLWIRVQGAGVYKGKVFTSVLILLKTDLIYLFRVFLNGSVVKNLLPIQETQVQPLGPEDLRRRKWQPTPVFLPGQSPGQRRLTGL